MPGMSFIALTDNNRWINKVCNYIDGSVPVTQRGDRTQIDRLIRECIDLAAVEGLLAAAPATSYYELRLIGSAALSMVILAAYYLSIAPVIPFIPQFMQEVCAMIAGSELGEMLADKLAHKYYNELEKSLDPSKTYCSKNAIDSLKKKLDTEGDKLEALRAGHARLNRDSWRRCGKRVASKTIGAMVGGFFDMAVINRGANSISLAKVLFSFGGGFFNSFYPTVTPPPSERPTLATVAPHNTRYEAGENFKPTSTTSITHNTRYEAEVVAGSSVTTAVPRNTR